jgi:hypothetical protein
MKKLLCVGVAAALFVAFAQFALAASPDAKTGKKQAGEPGAVVVAAVTATATVDAIDTAKRKMTLKWPDGKTKTIKVGKEVVNFDQIAIGDKVNTTFVEELAVFVKKSDAPPSAEETETVALAPKGAKPGVIVADTQVVTAKIEAINYRTRTVTLKGPAGQPKTLKVGNNVKNFKTVKKGDEIVVRFTEALAIIVEKQ